MKLAFASVLSLVVAASAFAGESGFLVNGEKHPTYVNGKKIGKTFAEFSPAAAESEGGKREPASAGNFKVDNDVTYYVVDSDTGVVCYSQFRSSLFCVKYKKGTVEK